MTATPANGFDFSVPAAATIAQPIDALFYSMLALSAVVSIVIIAIVIYFCVKYRRGSKADRSNPVVQNLGLEDTWIAIPLVIFLVMFFWAAALYQRIFTPPPDAIDIFIVAKQWMWKVQHSSGRREIDELHVPLGKPVRLVMTSQDVIHSFFVPAFRLKQDVLPGRYTAMWFEATKVGVYPLFCSEYCGPGHSRMGGTVIVTTPEQYQAWLAADSTPPAELAAQGASLYRSFGCAGCHDGAAGVHAPPLEHLYGSQVALTDGRRVAADERFLREAILDPRSHTPAGYDPIMPSFRGILTDEQLQQIVMYLKKPDAAAGNVTPEGSKP